VSGSYDSTIRIWTKGAEGEWSSEVLSRHGLGVHCLQALPDGRIVSGSSDKTIRIWTKGFAGRWAAEVLPEHRFYIRCLQVLPDGRIVSGDGADHVEIWAKTPVSTIEGFLRGLAPNLFERQWTSWVLGDCDHSSSVNTVQVLPDGRIVSGSEDGTIRIWDGEEMPGGKS
jgi:WD40 repeat protein